MIIACPACSARYTVSDNAIGIGGRTVRCARCRHSWFQPGPACEAAAPAAAAGEPAVVAAPRSVPEAAPDPAEPLPAIAGEPARVYADEPADRYQDESPSSFAFEPPFRPRGSRLRVWAMVAGLVAVVVLAAVAAVGRYGLPDWVPLAHATFARAQPDLVLDFPPNRQDRRTLPNGTEFFGASGTVTNVGQMRRTVPTILIVLRDARARIVYSYEVAPPKRI
ncbi:MAG: zinc-ribbon domain-containing protein, partial [Novosphingobium sp.]|nr:zinc-ribbon domain-containing protein [Novosphingobium sp.]